MYTSPHPKFSHDPFNPAVPPLLLSPAPIPQAITEIPSVTKY